MKPEPFDAAKRARLLAFLEAGWTLEAACAATPVSRTTVERWVARGRAGRDQDAAEFVRRLDESRAEADPHDDDLPPDHPLRWTTLDDPFLALEPDHMTLLTEEQREYVLAKARARWSNYPRGRDG